MFSENTLVLLHLTLIQGIGPRTVEKIVRSLFAHDESLTDLYTKRGEVVLAPLYSFSVRDFVSRCALSEKTAQALAKGLADKKALDGEISLLIKHGFSLVTLFDEYYPPLLKHIHAPPPLLYYAGNLAAPTERRIALVGARAANEYGTTVALQIACDLAHHGWTIVSGGAQGIDRYAHQGALQASGKTEVVLGSGLLRPYPAENKKLFENIVENGGALISAFPLMDEPTKGNFPVRNRIIAGMSQGCLVVQAAAKSGALISAQCALEEGRSVFAVPGLFGDELSAGCHSLIKQGAKLVHSVSDILEEFGEVFVDKKETVLRDGAPHASQRVTCSLVKEYRETNPLLRTLEQPHSIDELCGLLAKQAADLHLELFDLQIEGKVKQNFAGLWERV